MPQLRRLIAAAFLVIWAGAASAENALSAPELAPELEAQNEKVAGLYSEGRYADALELAREYLDHWEATLGEESPEWCSMYSNLGVLLTANGDMEAAEAAHRRGLACLRRTFPPESGDLASALNNYGSHLGFIADFGRAELALEESIRLLRLSLGEDHPYVAITLNNLGVNQQNQGNLVAGERTMRIALERLRASLGEDSPTTATAANNLGRLLAARGEFAEADPLLREALRVRESQLGDEHRHTCIGRRDLGRLMMRQDRPAEAEPHFREALAAFVATMGEEHPDVAMCRHELGRSLAAQSRHDEAERELAASLAIYEKNFEDGHSALVELQSELGEIDFARGRLEEARERFLAATAAYELGRSQTGTGLSRATYLDSPWFPLAALHLESGDEDEAWRAFEQAQGRVLEESLIPESGADGGKRRAAGTVLIGWLDVELGSETRSWAWSLRDERVRWHRLAGDDQRDDAIRAFRESIASPGPLGPLRSHAREVWRRRLAPLENELADARQVVVVPSGSMLGVPVGALVDDRDRWLGDRWTLSYAPSAEFYDWTRSLPPLAPGPGLFVGDPVLPGAIALADGSRRPSNDVIRGASHGLRESIDALPPLPGTREEVRILAGDWPQSTALLGLDASEGNLQAMAEEERLREYRVLHFATHALVDAEDADASALVLSQDDLPGALALLESGERIVDGIVTSREIIEQWRLDADLVVLSACNSALGRAIVGEGLVGFAHAFLRVGARSTLASQWSVPDRATLEFMTTFYRLWRGDGLSRAEALAAASRSLREHVDERGRLLYEHPYYWAPFVLVGDDR